MKYLETRISKLQLMCRPANGVATKRIANRMNNKLLASKILVALLDKKAILNGSTDLSINIIESVLSESGGSVSCEAHRPDIAILKSKFTNVYCHAILDDDLRDQQKVDKLWEWIETEILKVR